VKMVFLNSPRPPTLALPLIEGEENCLWQKEIDWSLENIEHFISFHIG